MQNVSTCTPPPPPTPASSYGVASLRVDVTAGCVLRLPCCGGACSAAVLRRGAGGAGPVSGGGTRFGLPPPTHSVRRPG